MRIIAVVNPDAHSSERKFLAEVTEDELWELTGRSVGTGYIRPGLEIQLPEILRVTKNVVHNDRLMQETTRDLRAMADLLESITGRIRGAVIQTEEPEKGSGQE